MNVKPDKDDPNRFLVESSSSKGKFHVVTLDKRLCDCPHFLYRMRKTGGVCKHIKAVEEYSAKHGKDDSGQETILDFDEVVEYVRKKGEVDSIELIDKFGEKAVDYLIKNGELMEEKGTIRVL